MAWINYQLYPVSYSTQGNELRMKNKIHVVRAHKGEDISSILLSNENTYQHPETHSPIHENLDIPIQVIDADEASEMQQFFIYLEEVYQTYRPEVISKIIWSTVYAGFKLKREINKGELSRYELAGDSYSQVTHQDLIEKKWAIIRRNQLIKNNVYEEYEDIYHELTNLQVNVSHAIFHLLNIGRVLNDQVEKDMITFYKN